MCSPTRSNCLSFASIPINGQLQRVEELPMKPTPSPFRSLWWALAGVVIALLLWPLWWLLTALLGEAIGLALVPIFLIFVGVLVFRFVRQLDKVEGPFPRSESNNERPN